MNEYWRWWRIRDDAELLCAGTLARARKDGAEIGICVMLQERQGPARQPVANLRGVASKGNVGGGKVMGAKLFTEANSATFPTWKRTAANRLEV